MTIVRLKTKSLRHCLVNCPLPIDLEHPRETALLLPNLIVGCTGIWSKDIEIDAMLAHLNDLSHDQEVKKNVNSRFLIIK
jgi:hypothetical protein